MEKDDSYAATAGGIMGAGGSAPRYTEAFTRTMTRVGALNTKTVRFGEDVSAATDSDLDSQSQPEDSSSGHQHHAN